VFSTLEIAVSYEEVTKIIPGLQECDFRYIIHLGVGRNGFITLEKRAHLGGYRRRDIHGHTGPLEPHEVYVTRWDVHSLVGQLQSQGVKVCRWRLD
jgi:hypothetical protein